MKKRPVIVTFFLIAGLSAAAFAQSKEEEKEWKAKLKDLTPMEYKQLVEEKEALQTEVQNATNQVEQYKSESEAKDAELEKLRAELEQAKAAAATAVAETPAETPQPANTSASASSGSAKGIVYKVQIGAFKNKDLGKYLNNHKNFSGEVDADGTRKYTLGEFTDYWEADRFKKYLREMGVKDAWIVSYKDGTRVPIKDALEGVL